MINLNPMIKINKKTRNDVQKIDSKDLFKYKKYTLLETVSILKYIAIKGDMVLPYDIVSLIDAIRELSDKCVIIQDNDIKDANSNEVSFELGMFYSDFTILCKTLDISNPFEGLTLNEVIEELLTLKEIDKACLSSSEVIKGKEDYTQNNQNSHSTSVHVANGDCVSVAQIQWYDTLFYLKNHCITGYCNSSINLEDVKDVIDKNISKLEQLILNTKNNKEKENLVFHIGVLIESLSTIAYDYDIPNELSFSLDTDLNVLLNTLDLVFYQFHRFENLNNGCVRNNTSPSVL